MDVVVIGAGIGGLSAALSLHAAGLRCRVYEAMAHVQPLAVGINLLPQATKELEALGLLPALLARGAPVRELLYLTRRGERIWHEPRGLDAGYRWPELAIPRTDLHAVLRDAVLERLGTGAIVTSRQAIDVRDRDGRVEVTFRHPDDASRRWNVVADLVIGADGIHSAIRAHVRPGEGAPRRGGRILWRGTTVTRPLLDGATMIVAGNSKTKFICYPIRKPERGRQLVHWRAVAPGVDVPPRSAADWNRHGSASALLTHFTSWPRDVLDVPELVRGAGEIYESVLSDRDPLPTWIFGRTTLLGDAAHPAYPIGSNGAAQAILDARRLAYELASQPTIDAALVAYDAARRPPTEQLTLAHRAEAVDLVLDMVEARSPEGWEDLEAILPQRERAELAAFYKWMAGFDLPALNETPALSPPERSDTTSEPSG